MNDRLKRIRCAPSCTYVVPLLLLMLGCDVLSDNNPGEVAPVPAGEETEIFAEQERIRAMTKVQIRLNELSAEDRSAPEINEAIAEFMRSVPEYDEVIVDPDGLVVRGVFRDQYDHIVLNNRSPTVDAATDSLLLAAVEVPALQRKTPSEHGTTADSRASRAAPFAAASGLEEEVPPRQARVMWGLGTGFNQVTGADRITASLQRAGYAVNQQNATLENFRNVSGDGIFYINAHASTTSIKTLTLWPAPEDTTTIRENRVLYGDGLTPMSLSGDDNIYIGINALFVRDFMSFGDNSLVFLHACSLDRDTDFRNALFEAGAKVVAAWDDLSTATVTPRFFFDRLLGDNELYPSEEPVQRPFDLDAVYGDMVKKGLHQVVAHYHVRIGRTEFFPNRRATLNIRRSPGATIPLLAPSLEGAEIDEQEEWLTLRGRFGSRTGKVEVNGTALSIRDWQPRRISAEFPATGPGSSGDVMVTVDGRESNTLQITEWRGVLRYTVEQGSLEASIGLDLRFRAVINDMREEIAGPTIFPVSARIEASRASTGTYEARGSEPTRDGSIRWKGSGDIPHAFDTPDGELTIFNAWGEARRNKAGEATLNLQVIATTLHAVEMTSDEGVFEYETAVIFSTLSEPFANAQFGEFGSRMLHLGGDFSSTSDRLVHPIGDNARQTLDIAIFTASSPPDPNARR